MTEPREQLMCAGGPLHGCRLSVPEGLQWFTLNRSIDVPQVTGGQENPVLPLESITELTDQWFGTWSNDGPQLAADVIAVYARKTFITGEHGPISVFAVR